MSTTEILIVDDFAPFRLWLRRELQQRIEWKIVGEASDGLNAVRQAYELRPDLILLDLGLPILSGMEALTRIRQHVPTAKVIVVSQEDAPEIVAETFRLGARGYIHKLRTQRDLCLAIVAVLGGQHFLSEELLVHGVAYPPRHDVQFYSDDGTFLERTAHFIGHALSNDSAAIVLATPAHREGLIQQLRQDGVDIDRATREGRYLDHDAADTLAHVMKNNQPDLAMFRAGLEHLLGLAAKAANAHHARVAIVGECVGLLCANGNAQAALQLEHAGNQLLTEHHIDILCAYPAACFPDSDTDAAFKSICAEHTAVHAG